MRRRLPASAGLLAVMLAACSPAAGRGDAPSATATGSGNMARARAPSRAVGGDAALRAVAVRVARDPRAYVTTVDEGDAGWSYLLDRIAAGDDAAIGIAERLRPHADAGRAEALDMAAAQALPHAPLRVLALASQGWRIPALCTSPFIEPAAGVARQYSKAALAALDGIAPAKRPQPAFGQCHAALIAIHRKL